MNPIGVVICNFNKKDFVLQCIQSVLESKVHNFDIYVVDNASSDGSVEAIKAEYADQVTVLENSENLGGSGGFNTGLSLVMEKGYKYFMCLDDDAQVDENAINALYEYMEANSDVGMAGSRVYHMQYPDYIQQCGINIDFKNCNATTLYADMLEDGSLPNVIECDTVATCAVMVRSEAAKTTLKDGSIVGIMPEDNFIYWDDMEWGHRIHLAGYKCITLGDSKVLHQMGANVKKPNTFIDYYMWRNRTNFFMKYTKEEDVESMSIKALSSIFDALYESMFREEHNVMQTISYAYHDALEGVRGKAADYKIMKNDANDDKLIEFIADKKTFSIIEDGMSEDAMYLRNFLEKENPDIKEVDKDADVVFHLCSYIFDVKDFSLNEIYIDSERNCIINNDDVNVVKNYEYSKLLFIYMNQGIFIRKSLEGR